MNDSIRRLAGRAGDTLANWVRPFAPRHPLILRQLRRLRAWMPRSGDPGDIGRFMETYGRAYPSSRFIQVGANDGSLYDPLRREILRRNWRGLMIEPVPDVFERLKANYPGYDRIALENVAIADHIGEQSFYHLARVDNPVSEGLPIWYAALGSFHKDVILKHRDLIPEIDRRLVERKVPCTTLNALCDKHQLAIVELIQIDTEGHDYEVIKLIDFARLQPRVVLYEHFHLSETDRRACQAFLAERGFECIERHYDTIALRVRDTTARDAELLALWAELRHPV